MGRFQVAHTPGSVLDINGHHLQGNTWYHPEDVGLPEDYLRANFPHFNWEQSESKTKEPEKIVESPIKKTKKVHN